MPTKHIKNTLTYQQDCFFTIKTAQIGFEKVYSTVFSSSIIFYYNKLLKQENKFTQMQLAKY